MKKNKEFKLNEEKLNVEKYSKKINVFVKKKEEKAKLTVLISSENKKKIKEKNLKISKLIDEFLTDFFKDIETQSQMEIRTRTQIQRKFQEPTQSQFEIKEEEIPF